MVAHAKRRAPALFDLQELNSRLAARIDSLVEALFGRVATRSPEAFRIGSADGEPGESCVVFRAPGRVGGFYDHNPAARHRRGDLLDLIGAAKGLQPGEAIRWAASFVGLDADAPSRDPGGWSNEAAGPDQLRRKENAFWGEARAVSYFRARGLADETMRRFHLGLSAPYQSKQTGLTVAHAVCFPVLDSAGTPVRRFGMLAVPGLTLNAPKKAWCAGKPRTYYATSAARKTRLLVAEGQKDLWMLAQMLSAPEDQDLLLISSTHGSAIPAEWSSPSFWECWDEVYLAQDSDDAGDAAALKVAHAACRDVRRVRVPDPSPEHKDWTDFFRSGGSAAELRRLLAEVPVFGADPPRASAPGSLNGTGPGEYEVRQVNVNGAYVNGRMYYPFNVESIEIETEIGRDGTATSRKVHSYKTKIVRSDAVLLDVVELIGPHRVVRGEC